MFGDYSNWLRKRVKSTKNWNKFMSCLIDSKVCKSLIDDGSNTPVETFYKERLSIVQVSFPLSPYMCLCIISIVCYMFEIALVIFLNFEFEQLGFLCCSIL